ncbi:MAG: hypothetical protein ACLP50_14590 [Solirubrobacteraceae bacterium]
MVQLAGLALVMVLVGALSTVGLEVLALASSLAVGGLLLAAVVSGWVRRGVRGVVVVWWGRFGFVAPAWRPLLAAGIAAAVVGVGEVTGAVASTGGVLPVTALTLGMIVGVSVLPGNPVRLRERHAFLWALLAVLELAVVAVVVVMVVGVLDWLLTGTVYAADVVMPFPVAFPIALLGVVTAAWYLSRGELLR